MDNKKLQQIPFVTDEGKEVNFAVLEQTTIAGFNYLLVSEDADDEDAYVYIMKEIQHERQEETISYEIVEDERELDSISKVFTELMDYTDIVKEF